MDDPKETTYLTAQEVADLKKVSLSTVKRATAAEILKNHRVKTKKNQKRFARRYLLADVERWKASVQSLADFTDDDLDELDPAAGTGNTPNYP